MLWIRRLGVVVAFFLWLSVAALSEPPAPSTGNPVTQLQSQTSQNKTNAPNDIQTANPPARPEQNSKALPVVEPPKAKDEKGSWYSSSEWWLVYLTGALAAITGLLALFTGGLYFATYNLAKDAKESGVAQSEKMQAAIKEASRSATATEDVASHLKINADKIVESVEINKSIGEKQKLYSEMQMGAYVSVDIGSGLPQNTATGFRFEARPIFVNNGMTPARNFCYFVKAGIFSVPLRDDFSTTLEIPQDSAKGLIPPRQTRFIHAVVEHLVPEDEVQGIMDGKGQSLYVWGAFAYDDVFGVHRKNEFCHQITFFPNRDGDGFTISGVFVGNRNKET